MPNYALLVSLFLRTGKAQSGVEAQLHTKGEANYIPKWKPIIYQSGSPRLGRGCTCQSQTEYSSMSVNHSTQICA